MRLKTRTKRFYFRFYSIAKEDRKNILLLGIILFFLAIIISSEIFMEDESTEFKELKQLGELDNQTALEELSSQQNSFNIEEMKETNYEVKDITNETNKIIDNVGEYEIKKYYIDLIGASIDYEKIIHVTYKLDRENIRKSNWLKTVYGIDTNSTLLLNTLKPFFLSIKKFFKKFPDATSIIMYFVDIEDEIDRYGNKTGVNKNIINSFGINKNSVEKIDWEYVNNNLSNDIVENDGSHFINMLDFAYIDRPH